MAGRQRGRVAMPARIFLWTVDQVALMVSLSEGELRTAHLYFDGRSTGTRFGRMTARNIAAPEATPDWRVSQSELVKWLRSRGYEYYDEGGFSG